MSVSSWSTTAALNTSVGGISIAENCARANMNDALRAVMAEAKAGFIQGVSVKSYGAIGDGTTDDYASIASAIAACVAAGGGTVLFPAGTYAVSAPVAKPTLVKFAGDGSRSSIIKCTGVTATYPNGVVTSTNGGTGILFSTGITGMGIDANGIANVCLYVQGDQENCVYDDLVLDHFLVTGLKCASITATTHKATFRDFHVVPHYTGTTAAVAVDLADVHNCLFDNITTDKSNSTDTPPGDGAYAVGVRVASTCILNTFRNLHTEDALIGIDHAGEISTFDGLQALNNYGGGTAHFKNTGGSYTISNIFTAGTSAAYTYHIQDTQAGNVAQGTDTRTASRIVQVTGSAVTALDSNNGHVYGRAARFYSAPTQLRGPGGGSGVYNTSDQIGFTPSQARTLSIVAEGISITTGLSGKLHVYASGTSALASIEVPFHLAVSNAGVVSSSSVGTATGTNTGLFTYAIAAHGTPGAGKFKITVTSTDAVNSTNANVRVELAAFTDTMTGLTAAFA